VRVAGRRPSLALPFAALLLAAACTGEPAPPVRAEGSEPVAAGFVERLLDGRHDEMVEMMTPPMVASLPAEVAQEMRAELSTELGALVRTHPAWYENRMGELRRFRVPVEYERRTVDLRVVLDGEDKVTGLFVLPRLDPRMLHGATPPGVELEVLVGGDGTGLPGTLTLPRSAGPYPAAVLVHDTGPHDRNEEMGPNHPLRDVAWGLAARGIASLRYDKRSFARADAVAALGESLTVQEEVIDDARAALDLLRSRDDIDADRLYVVGHGLGGTLAPRIALEPPQPAGVVVLGGSTRPFPETLLGRVQRFLAFELPDAQQREQALRVAEEHVAALRRALDGKAEPPSGFIFGAPFGYYRDLERLPPAEAAQEAGVPILVLHGGQDIQVGEEDFQGWREGLAGLASACLRSYADLDHLFRSGIEPGDVESAGPVAPRVLEDIAGWIKEGRCPV
jgi:dienelactone hydrolase